MVGFDVAFRIGARALLRIDMGGTGNAQHGVMRLVHMRLGIVCRIGRDERQVTRISEIDQSLLGALPRRASSI